MPALSKDQKLQALRNAIMDGDAKAVRALTKDGDIDLNSAVPGVLNSFRGASFLHLAALVGNLNIVSTLVEHGARKDLRDARDMTPADYAALHLSQTLNNLGYEAAPPKLAPLPPMAPKMDLIGAVERDIGLTRIGNEIFGIEKRPDPTTLTTEQKQAALRNAIMEGDVPWIKEIANSGIDLNVPLPGMHASMGGATALHLAALVGNTQVIEALSSAGARPETKDARGLVPAAYAVINSRQAFNSLGMASGNVALSPLPTGAMKNNTVGSLRRSMGLGQDDSKAFGQFADPSLAAPVPTAPRVKAQADIGEQRISRGVYYVPPSPGDSAPEPTPAELRRKRDVMHNPFALEMRPQP
jgi:ankyrin repeat protein